MIKDRLVSSSEYYEITCKAYKTDDEIIDYIFKRYLQDSSLRKYEIYIIDEDEYQDKYYWKVEVQKRW